MITRLSRKMTHYLLNHQVIDEDMFDVYVYGMNYFLNIFINVIGIVIISLIYHIEFEAIGFTVGFILTRKSTGGYHADSELKCILSSYLVFLISMLYLTTTTYSLTLSISMMVISSLGIHLFAPVDHYNRRLTDAEKVRFKKQSYTLVLLMVVLMILSLLTKLIIIRSLSLGIYVACLSMLVAKYKNWRSKNDEPN